MDVSLLSGIYLKLHERFFMRNYLIYRNDRHPGAKGGTEIAARKGVPRSYVVVPHLISIEATRICIPLGNKEILLAAVYKFPIRDWSDTDMNEILSLRNKTILAGDLNAKYLVWNSQISNRTGMRLLKLQDNSDFQISAPRHPTHYTPSGNGVVLDIVLYRNVRMFDITVLEILDSDHLPILFHMLDHVSTRDISAPIEIHTDWERFQSLASDLTSPRTQIHTPENAEEAARKFAASIASAYWLSTHKIAILKLNKELPELERLLQLKQRLRKLWQETRDPTCKTAVNWVTKTIRRTTLKVNRTMRHETGKLRGYTSGNMAHCESPAEQECSKGINRDSWLFGPIISSVL
jgi:hypothetical protein